MCVDELGHAEPELDKHGAELLFQVLTERGEKNSVVIASNEALGGPRPSPVPAFAQSLPTG